MMTVIKIAFVILMLIPIAVLMRYLLSRLYQEPSGQTDTDGSPPRRRKKEQKADKKTDKKETEGRTTQKRENENKKRGEKPIRAHEKDAPRSRSSTGRSSSYTPRKPQELKRSKRVPFDESLPKKTGYTQPGRVRPSDAAVKRRAQEEKVQQPPRQASMQTSNEETLESWIENAPIKRKPRSERKPTKRQLRRNRERARKRDMKRRQEEDKNREKDTYE